MNNGCTGIKRLMFFPVHHEPALNLSIIRVLNSFNVEFFTIDMEIFFRFRTNPA